MTSNQSNNDLKLIMQRFVEFINTANKELGNELISPKAIFHVPGKSEPMSGPEGYLATIEMMRGGFSDIQWVMEEHVIEGERVAARFTMKGTVRAINFYHFSKEGQIIEEYGQPDMLGLLVQIGGLPPHGN